MTLDMQLREGVSMHCEMYFYITRHTGHHIFVDHYFKDNIVYRLPIISYAISANKYPEFIVLLP